MNKFTHINTEFILNLFKNKKNGYFVEIGACNGILGSQCYNLEVDFQWNGITIEPMKSWKKSDKRKNWCNYAISNINSITQFVELPTQPFRSALKTVENKDNYMIHNNKNIDSIKKVYDVNVRTLYTVLDEYKSPNIIDWITIDAEGAEFDITECFFKENNKYDVIIFTVEINKFYWPEQYVKILNLFKENNYIEIYDIRTYNKEEKGMHDKHFINKKYKNNFITYEGN